MDHGVFKIGLFASVSTEPILYGIEALKGRAVFEYDCAINLFEKMQNQKLDIALLSPYAIFKNPKLLVIPKVGVIFENISQTFKLCAKSLPDSIHNILIDRRAALDIDFLRMIVPRLLMVHPEITISDKFITANHNFSEEKFDAFILVEEDAMKCDYNFTMSWDLGEAWKRYSGQSLIRYIFALQPNLNLNKLDEILLRMAQNSQRLIKEIAYNAAKKYGLDEIAVRNFYLNNVKYILDARSIASIKTLNRELATADILKGQVPIKMYQG